MPVNRPGRLIAVGLGPGDPELVTLKAVQAIQRAKVIAFIGARGRASQVRQIAARHIRPGVRELAFAMPGVGEPAEDAPIHDVIATAVASELSLGHDVAFLCEGDPAMHGPCLLLVERLHGRFPCVAIPGVASLSAAAAAALRPLLQRGEPLAVLPATLGERSLETLARATGHVVIVNVGRRLAKVRGILRAADLLDEAVLVENAGLPDERVRDIAGIRDDIVSYFALVIAHRRPAAPGDGTESR